MEDLFDISKEDLLNLDQLVEDSKVSIPQNFTFSCSCDESMDCWGGSCAYGTSY